MKSVNKLFLIIIITANLVLIMQTLPAFRFQKEVQLDIIPSQI